MITAKKIFELAPAFIFRSFGDEKLSEDTVIHYLATLLEIGRMEGESFQEHEFASYVVSYLGLPAESADKARQLVSEQSLTLAELVDRIDDPVVRVCILRDAYLMTKQDGKVAQVEWLALERLTSILHLSGKAGKKITGMVDAMVELKEELIKLGGTD